MTSIFSANRRYLALWFPFLPADRLRRTRPDAAPADASFVLVEKQKGAMRVVAASPAALQAGLVPGMALADARAQRPDLAIFDLDRAADAIWLDRIADGCARYTPMVALNGIDGLVLDISGCAHLFGGEAGLRADLIRRLHRLGMTVRTALADTPDAAHAQARYGEDIAVMPVEALELSPEAMVALRRAGLKRIGDLTARPSAPLAARFGEVAIDRLAQVTGERDIRISPRRPEPALVVECGFAEPIGHIPAMLAALAQLAEAATRQMQAVHRGGRRFEAQLFRTDGLMRDLRIETGLPTRDVPLLMRLFNERIATLHDPIDPGFGFDLVRLSVPLLEALGPLQLSLESEVTAQDEVARLVDRLSTRLGPDRVRRFAPRDSHIPERAMLAFPAIERCPESAWPVPEPGEPPLRPVHLFDPPQSIEVVAGIPDGPPRQFRWRRTLYEVTRAEGPERIGALWWHRADNQGLSRDYYRVEDRHGHRFWLFRHGIYGREAEKPLWYLHGLFA